MHRAHHLFNGGLCIRWHYAIFEIAQHETDIDNFGRKFGFRAIHGLCHYFKCFGKSNNAFNVHTFAGDRSVLNHRTFILLLEKLWCVYFNIFVHKHILHITTLVAFLPLWNPQDCTFSTAYCALLFDGHLLILHMLLKYMISIHLVLPLPKLLQCYGFCM